ncbi:MAG: ABC transporter substrate-binding protein [Chloroflexi bacterium]|nr:ABC transporter substrate-binding protein [Chloroflexota bacterium]
MPSLTVECEVCEEWEMEDDGAFVFRLRQDVVWQDLSPLNGRQLTAEDIVFSYNRQRQQDRPNAALLGAVESLEALDPKTLRISLSVPDADFMLSLAHGHTKIVAPEAVALNGDLRDGPTVGSGPWILKETGPDAIHAFDRNPSYFEEGRPLVDELLIHIIPDTTIRNAAFRVGSIDVEQMDEPRWEQYLKRRPSAPFLLVPDTTGVEIGLNARAAVFEDVRVRRAVFQATDPWNTIDQVWRGKAYPSPGFPVASADWLLPEDELRGYFADPDRARELLREAGARLPVPVVIKVGDFGDAYQAHAERIADEMRRVGFEPEIEVVNRRAFGDEVWLGGDYQMFLGPPAPSATPNGYLLPVLHSQGRLNTSGVDDRELDGLIEAQAQEFDPAVRTELVQAIQRKMLDNASRFMPAARLSVWTWSDRVQDFYPNFALFEYSHWSRVWLQE